MSLATKLKSKIAKGLALAGTGALSILNTGCIAPSENENRISSGDYLGASVVFDAAGIKTGKAGWFLLGDASRTAASIEGQREAAETLADRLRTDSNQQTGSNQQIPNENRNNNMGRTPYSTAFIEWVDKNGDGHITYDELIGAGRSFSMKNLKELRFMTFIENHAGEKAEFYLFHPSGRVISNGAVDIKSNRAIPNIYLFTSEFKERHIAPNCLVNWRLNGQTFDAYYVDLYE